MTEPKKPGEDFIGWLEGYKPAPTFQAVDQDPQAYAKPDTSEHAYKMRYTMQHGAFNKRDRHVKSLTLQDTEFGMCDSFILHSILHPDDGTRHEQIVSFDGRTGGELPAEEWHKSWCMLTTALSESPALGTHEHREFFNECFDRYMQRFHPDMWARRQANIEAHKKANQGPSN